jgi:hypothetical protein
MRHYNLVPDTKAYLLGMVPDSALRETYDEAYEGVFIFPTDIHRLEERFNQQPTISLNTGITFLPHPNNILPPPEQEKSAIFPIEPEVLPAKSILLDDEKWPSVLPPDVKIKRGRRPTQRKRGRGNSAKDGGTVNKKWPGAGDLQGPLTSISPYYGTGEGVVEGFL